VGPILAPEGAAIAVRPRATIVEQVLSQAY
jgi:hypothetical protein